MLVMPPYTPPVPKTDIVVDLVREGAIVAFLLESVHTDEVKHGYPACGEAGRNLSYAVLGRTDIPLTLLIEHPQIAKLLGIPDLSHIAVMNVSQRPLQQSAYLDNSLTLPRNMKTLEGVKRALEKKPINDLDAKIKFTPPAQERAQKNLYKDFCNRFHPHRDRFKLVIPCGHIAYYFMSWYLEKNPDPPFAILKGLGHPAKTGKPWIRKGLADRNLEMLRKLVNLESVGELVRSLGND
ncbi:hypothetical protein [Archangium sp.]|uniref:hypothetical protein n=1 Tax=Archangium sp. TaxID=1872627 RepID=UPI00389B1CFD